jgi:hypothetical protein
MNAKRNKTRAVPSRDSGTKRGELYKAAHEKINAAMAAGFFLEAITLCDRIIGDRLEARIACIHKQDPAKRTFMTLEQLTKSLTKADLREPQSAVIVYGKVKNWADKRNRALA